MKLSGYIKELKSYSFAIPIYTDGKNFYTHDVSESFRIVGFEKILLPSNYIKIFSVKNYIIGSEGAIVFVGKDRNLFYNEASLVLPDIDYYIDQTTSKTKYLNIKNEITELKLCLRKLKIKEVIEAFDVVDVRNISVIEPQFMSVIEEHDYVEVPNNLFILSELVEKGAVTRYSLDEYLMHENEILNSIPNTKKDLWIKLDIISNKIIDKFKIEYQDKQILKYLLDRYMSNNIDVIEGQIIGDLSSEFFKFLEENKSLDFLPVEMTIEETLRFRAEERRRKMKEFNYKFENRFSNFNEIEREPTYKRMGVEIDLKSNVPMKVIYLENVPESNHVKEPIPEIKK